MTKEEKVKEAWGELNDEINENGWLYFGYACNGWDDVENWLEDNNLISDESYYHMTYDECDNGDLICVQIRPKSLQGIEDNNSWVKIESEEDLPNTHIDVVLYDTINNITFGFWDNLQMCFKDRFGQEYKNATHYKPIEKPNPPLF